jgi:hypothetical protein
MKQSVKIPFDFAVALRGFQISQQTHDLKNHFEIISMSKSDRLKHYGLHFAKYVGRLYRGGKEKKTITRTLTDAFLIALSSANTLNINASENIVIDDVIALDFEYFADWVGVYCDGCEKIDHFEESRVMLVESNQKIINWIMSSSMMIQYDLSASTLARRDELARRLVYNEFKI